MSGFAILALVAGVSIFLLHIVCSSAAELSFSILKTRAGFPARSCWPQRRPGNVDKRNGAAKYSKQCCRKMLKYDK